MLAFIALLIVYGSLYPWHFDFSRAHGQNPLWTLLRSWPYAWNRFLIRDAFFNVALYVPLGAAAYRSLARRLPARWAMVAAVLGGVALSAAMEMLQIYVPGRDCSLVDLLTNTIGAAVGAVGVAIWRTDAAWGMPRRRDAGAMILAACWAGFQWWPFFPTLGRTALATAFSAWLRTPWFQPVEIWANTAEWFTAALLVEAAWPTVQEGWIPVVMAGCLGRLLVRGRVLSMPEVIGAAIALWLWMASRKQRRIAMAVGMLTVAIVLRELAPFHFAHSPSAFRWIPFAASLMADRDAALIVLLHKAFSYGALVWLWRRRGAPYWIAGPAIAMALLGCEWLQRYIPGRTPETTDAVMAVLLALLLGLSGRDYPTRNYNLYESAI
jgi:VanZ family protein